MLKGPVQLSLFWGKGGPCAMSLEWRGDSEICRGDEVAQSPAFGPSPPLSPNADLVPSPSPSTLTKSQLRLMPFSNLTRLTQPLTSEAHRIIHNN